MDELDERNNYFCELTNIMASSNESTSTIGSKGPKISLIQYEMTIYIIISNSYTSGFMIGSSDSTSSKTVGSINKSSSFVVPPRTILPRVSSRMFFTCKKCLIVAIRE